jgi:hypothetical protein
MFKPTKLSILSAAVRAATAYGADVDVVGLVGQTMAILDADAQGDGVTLNAKLQSSPALARGYAAITAGDNDIPLRNGASDNVKLAAVFTQAAAGQIKRVALMLKQKGAITAGKKIWITIEADNAGDPSGTPLATSAKLEAAGVAAAYGFVVFTFTVPLDLAAETDYHVVLQGDYDAGATNQIQWRAATVAELGNSMVYDSAWAAVATNEFELYADQYAFADIAGAAFTEVGNAAAFESLPVDIDAVGDVIRAVATVAGGEATGASSLVLVAEDQYR